MVIAFLISLVIITHRLTYLPVNTTISDSHKEVTGLTVGFATFIGTDDNSDIELDGPRLTVAFMIVLSTDDRRIMQYLLRAQLLFRRYFSNLFCLATDSALVKTEVCPSFLSALRLSPNR